MPRFRHKLRRQHSTFHSQGRGGIFYGEGDFSRVETYFFYTKYVLYGINNGLKAALMLKNTYNIWIGDKKILRYKKS